MSDKSTIHPLHLGALAAITGGFVGLAAGAIAALAGKGFFLYAAVGFCLAAGVAWLGLLYWWQRVMEAERGILPAAPAPDPVAAETVKLAVSYSDGRAGDFIWLPEGIGRERFSAWCAGIHNGRSLGENHWTGSSGLFSKGEYHAMLDVLLVRGYVRRAGRHHTAGYEMTGKGAAVAAELARRHVRGAL